MTAKSFKNNIFLWIILLLAVVIIFLLHFMWGAIIASFALAFIINPLVKVFEKKGASRSAAILTTYFVLLVIISLVSYILLPVILYDLQNLTKTLPSYMQKWDREMKISIAHISKHKWPPYLVNAIQEAIKILQEKIRQIFLQVFLGIINFFKNVYVFFITPFLAYYISRDFTMIRAKLEHLFTDVHFIRIKKTIKKIENILNHYLRGQLLIALLVGIMLTFGLVLLKIEFALVIGLLSGLLDLIPYFGPIISILPALLFALIQSPWTALYVMILYIIVNQVEALFLSPKILGNSVGLHPIIIFFTIIIAGETFGIFGMLISVPIAGIIKILLDEYFSMNPVYKVNS